MPPPRTGVVGPLEIGGFMSGPPVVGVPGGLAPLKGSGFTSGPPVVGVPGGLEPPKGSGFMSGPPVVGVPGGLKPPRTGVVRPPVAILGIFLKSFISLPLLF
jgi:hypothetical protein